MEKIDDNSATEEKAIIAHAYDKAQAPIMIRISIQSLNPIPPPSEISQESNKETKKYEYRYLPWRKIKEECSNHKTRSPDQKTFRTSKNHCQLVSESVISQKAGRNEQKKSRPGIGNPVVIRFVSLIIRKVIRFKILLVIGFNVQISSRKNHRYLPFGLEIVF
jgi:hypothetical protein